ncbi:MAG: iron-sulfur cluster assembly scaffold protein, partial [bacterium]
MAGQDRLKPDPLDSLQADVDRAMSRVYSPRVLELFRDPQNAGRLDQPSGYAAITGSCGDTMQVRVKLAGGKVERATFWTDGCGNSMVCGSMATILATGRTVESA